MSSDLKRTNKGERSEEKVKERTSFRESKFDIRSIRRNREWICRQSHKHAANAETKSFSAFYLCLFRILTQEFSRRAQKLMDWQYYSAVSGFNTPASVTSGGGGDANPSAKSLYVGDLDPAIDEATLTNMFSMCNDVCFFFLFLLLFVFKLFLLFFLRSFFLSN